MLSLVEALKERATFYAYCGTMYAIVGCLLIITLAPSLLHAEQRQAVSSQKPILPAGRVVKNGKPSQMSIPRLQIDLPLQDGDYNPTSGEWTLSEQHAYFALPSPYANDYQGNTLIYGHNNVLVFAKLDQLQYGDELVVSTSNGHVFRYIYVKSQAVPPDNLSVFRYEGPPIVTVQTCSGSWYQNRSLYTFILKGVES